MPAGPPGVAQPSYLPNSFETWARNILKAMGMDDDPNPVVAVVCWIAGEAPATPTGAQNNPMNSTQQISGSTDFNSVGVQNYKTKEDGLKATVQTIRNGRYDDIIAALRDKRDYVTTTTIIDRSDWRGTNHSPHYVLIARGIKNSGGMTGPAYKALAVRRINSPGSSAWRSIPIIGGGIADAQASVKDAVGGVADALGSIGDAIGVITDPHTWYRIGQVLFGAILIGMGIYMFVRGPAMGLAGTAGKLKGKGKGSFAKPKVGTELEPTSA